MKSLLWIILGDLYNISKTLALLGLLSWNIYLDLNIVDTTVDIEFHDQLVSVRGVVILGV